MLFTSAIPSQLLVEQLRHAVLDYLVEEEAITEDFAHKLLSWKHSGFSVDNKVRIKTDDAEGRKQLARYMIHNPFSLEKMSYKTKQGVVVYRSKLHATLKRNYQLMLGAEWLKLLIRHIPDKGEHLVRYYGWYSSRCRESAGGCWKSWKRQVLKRDSRRMLLWINRPIRRSLLPRSQPGRG